MPNYVTQQQAGAVLQVHPRSIRRWISAGFITGYRLPGPGNRAIRVNLDEVRAAMTLVPAIRAGTKPYGPRARIVTVAEVVPPTPPPAP